MVDNGLGIIRNGVRIGIYRDYFIETTWMRFDE